MLDINKSKDDRSPALVWSLLAGTVGTSSYGMISGISQLPILELRQYFRLKYSSMSHIIFLVYPYCASMPSRGVFVG